jgi:hypothetical protein
MKRAVIGFLLSVVLLPVQAQQAKQLVFREEIHDFGVVDENKGPVTHEFKFTNNSNRPVNILKVQASCGCTTPGWTREPVPPGGAGFVQASYNPKGRPGFFNKSLTVTTDLEPNPIILYIKGQVTDIERPSVSEFPVSKGNLKFKTGSFNMGRVYRKDEYVVREFPVMNAGTKEVTFTGKFVHPSHIKLETLPTTLKPGERGVVKVSYNGSIKNSYGFQSDNIQLTTDDDESPLKSFTVFATLEDFFPELTGTDLARAPQLVFTSNTLDLGNVRKNTATEREITFTNTGKKELELRAIQPNCSCVTASPSKTTLKPGESGTLKISFNPANRTGTQNKAIAFYTNDPRNPVQRLTLTAYVN